jgi:DNA-binding NarL/FixJ family response regulator
VIVEALPVVRTGMALLVATSPDLEVLAEARSADEGLRVVTSVRRSRVAVLVGLGLDGPHDAPWLIRAIRERHPAHVVLAVGANADPTAISRALFVGADGFIDKRAEPEEFLSAIARAATGEMTIAGAEAGTIGSIAEGLHRRRELDSRLTEREREVLTVAAEGLTAREIASRLGVRERTVTTHLGHIYGKLGVGSRLAAVRIAARSGLVSVGGASE